MTEYAATDTDGGYGDASYPKGVVLGTKGVYTVPASGAAGNGDTIAICTVPAGAVITNLVLTGSAGTNSLTITVGDGTTATAFGTVSDATGAFEHVGTGMNVETTAETDIILTLGGANPTAAHVYTCCVMYFMASD